MGFEAAVRGHEILAHTADAGVAARAPDLPGLFEEAAAALAELAADVEPGAPRDRVPVELAAADPVALAYAWLNELIGLADVRTAAVAGARVEALTPGELGGERSLVLRATADLVRYGPGARPRLEVKSATYHGLAVEPDPDGGGWTLTAYLDV